MHGLPRGLALHRWPMEARTARGALIGVALLAALGTGGLAGCQSLGLPGPSALAPVDRASLGPLARAYAVLGDYETALDAALLYARLPPCQDGGDGPVICASDGVVIALDDAKEKARPVMDSLREGLERPPAAGAGTAGEDPLLKAATAGARVAVDALQAALAQAEADKARRKAERAARKARDQDEPPAAVRPRHRKRTLA